MWLTIAKIVNNTINGKSTGMKITGTLSVLRGILLFLICVKSALEEGNEAFDREVITAYRDEHFSFR